jgi:hypothetical protein
MSNLPRSTQPQRPPAMQPETMQPGTSGPGSKAPGSKPGSRSAKIAAPILITAVGVGWLLTAQGMIPGVQWAWVLGLAALGGLVLFLEGVNKFSFIAGPSLIVGSLLSILRQTGYVSVDTEVPLLTITVGILWTLTFLLPLRHPSWILPD